MKLNKELQAIAAERLMAEAADAAAPFRSLANEIRSIAQAKGNANTATTNANESLWGAFKSALSIAHDAGMSASSMKLGLAVACAEADVPAGSYRSYVATVSDMLADVNGGGITIEAALLMKVKDAREKYQDAAKKARREANARLTEATKDWTTAQVNALADQCIAANEATKAEKQQATG